MDRKQKEALVIALSEKEGVNALVNRSAVIGISAHQGRKMDN